MQPPDRADPGPGSTTPPTPILDDDGHAMGVVEDDGEYQGEYEFVDSFNGPDEASPPTIPPTPAGREAAWAGPPLSRRRAEMAANETQTIDEYATHRDQAVEAGHDPVSNTEVKKSQAELEAEIARLSKAQAETNRKAKADRLRVEEFEKAQREAEEAKLGEGDRLKRERDTIAADRQRFQAEAKAAREELDRFRVDVEIERLALATGFEYPETVPKLIDRSLIEIDEDTGKPLNLKDVLKRLSDKFPNLVRATTARPGTPPRAGQPTRNAPPVDQRQIDAHQLERELRSRVKY